MVVARIFLPVVKLFLKELAMIPIVQNTERGGELVFHRFKPFLTYYASLLQQLLYPKYVQKTMYGLTLTQHKRFDPS